MDKVKVRRALLSVSDKEGVVGLAKGLSSLGVEILATGGTAKKLTDAGVKILALESITGNPEAFGGRMKTISFPFASALLFRRDHAEDVETAQKMGIQPIDLVVCNLYPFEEARAKGANDESLVEEIDVGGPTMVRAAAKNHAHVSILSSPAQYADFLAELEESAGSVSLSTRKKLAVAAFRMTAAYDSAISEEFSKRYLGEEVHYFCFDRGHKLRYGENPHQAATFFRNQYFSHEGSIASAQILQGKALSYNNLLDADAAHRVASDAWHALNDKGVTVSIIKHLNPCGIANASTPLAALQNAWAGDPVSAFGGIICFTSELTADCAQWLEDKFLELVIAPSVSGEALAIFAKKKNLRVLLCPPRKPAIQEKTLRSVYGGVLIQDEDEGLDVEIQSVTKEAFPKEKLNLAQFGIMVTKHLRSNAIGLFREKNGVFQMVGAGMGQPNRINSINILAAPRAKEKGSLDDLLMVSDAFFPFPDAVEAAHRWGIRAIIQPGGSIKDKDVIKTADELGIAMAFTGRRHFRH